MRSVAGALIGLAFLAGAVCCQSVGPASSDASGASPLAAKTGKMPKSNALCMVCHLDFEDDPLTVEHLAKSITCAHCHGTSVPHMHDESMMTSPDVLYGRREVEAMCGRCHGPHGNRQAVEAFRTRWLGKARENGRAVLADSVCTDCHGRHTVSRR